MLDDGTPADPVTYDYQAAARDALHFAALFDRFVQNLRPYLGYDVQYFATVEPQNGWPPCSPRHARHRLARHVGRRAEGRDGLRRRDLVALVGCPRDRGP